MLALQFGKFLFLRFLNSIFITAIESEVNSHCIDGSKSISILFADTQFLSVQINRDKTYYSQSALDIDYNQTPLYNHWKVIV